jgi:TonB family protein
MTPPAQLPAMRVAIPILLLAVIGCGAPTPGYTVIERAPVVERQPVPACTDHVVRDLYDARISMSGRVMALDSSIVLPPAFADSMYRVLANRHVRLKDLRAPAAARIEFEIRRDGTVGDSIRPRYSGPPWFAEDILKALGSAVLTRSIPRMPRELEGPMLPLVFEVRSARAEPGWHPFPLRLALDTAIVDEDAMAAPGNRAPSYPRDLRARGVSGDVLIQFIVDTNGRADMSSVTPRLATAPGFLDAVVEHLPSMRYYAATVGGCAVPGWVMQPFSFRVWSRDLD